LVLFQPWAVETEPQKKAHGQEDADRGYPTKSILRIYPINDPRPKARARLKLLDGDEQVIGTAEALASSVEANRLVRARMNDGGNRYCGSRCGTKTAVNAVENYGLNPYLVKPSNVWAYQPCRLRQNVDIATDAE
jgi:hypothetical protein